MSADVTTPSEVTIRCTHCESESNVDAETHESGGVIECVQCGEDYEIDRAEVVAKWTRPAGRVTVSPTEVEEGQTIAVSIKDCEHIGVPERDRCELTWGLLVTVNDIREGVEYVTDMYGETPSGAKVHIYPRRGKVERIDDRSAGEYGVTSLVNCFGYAVEEGGAQ